MTEQVQPITPEDVYNDLKNGKHVPGEVIEIFNNLISKKFMIKENFARITKPEIISEISEVLGISQSDIFNFGWLDKIEPVFEGAGWVITKGRNASDIVYLFSPKK